MRRRSALVLLAAGVAGCGGGAPPDPGYNDTDVMFLQMSIEHTRQGDPVAALAATRATGTEVRRIAAALQTRWRAESATMRQWLTEWQRPASAAPDAGVHAGHGDLHSLRDADVAELRAATGTAFDRTALSLLLGHLHNVVETSRMETAGGRFPPAVTLAAETTRTAREHIRRMLGLVAALG